MANENDIGGKVSLDTTDFKSNITELNRQIRVIDSGFKAAAAGMDDWSASEEGLQKRIESLNQITDLQRQKVANLTAQYEKVAAEKGATSKEAQNLQVRINKETESLNKNLSQLRKSTDALENFGGEMVDVSKDADKMGDALQEAQDQLRDIGGKVSGAAAAGIAAVGAAALAAIGSLTGFANSTDKAMNKFQAQTGASVEEMEEFRDVAEELYKANLGDSIEDVANSMATARQVTGQVGEELENTTRNALLLRDTFDFDVNESVRAADSLMKQFGITSDEAYTLIAQGAQNGANRNGDMLDVLNEYAPQFQALGFSADEFTNILIDGAENGAFSIDKVGDAVKEFNIRAKDMSDTSLEAFEALGMNGEEMSAQFAAGGESAQKAFQTVIKELQKVEDPLERNKIGVGLFGTQFEDLEAAAILAMGEIGTTANSTADTLQKINEVQYNDIGSALEGLKRSLITEIADPIGEQVLPILQNMIDDVKNIDVQPIVDGFSWIIDNAGNLAAGAAAIGAAMVTWNVVSTVTSLVKAIQAWRVATQGMTIAQAALNAVMAANPIGLVITVVAALVAGIITLWHTNDDFRKSVIKAWNAIKQAAVDVWEWIVKFFTEDIPKAFQVVLDFLKENWVNILLLITNPIGAALKLLYDLNPRFREWVDNVFRTIVDTLKKLPGQIGGFFTNIYDNVVSWGTDIIRWAKTEIPKIVKNIVDIFGSLPDRMIEIGKDVVRGIWEGIKGMGTWLKDKVSGFADQVVDDFKTGFGIFSPSRVMRDQVGEMIGAGMAEGIEASARQVRAAMDEINGVVTNNPTMAGAGGSAASQTISYHFDRMFEGANFQIRNENDIRLLAQQFGDYVRAKGAAT